MTEEIRNQLLDVLAIGQVAYDGFRKERFIDKTGRFSEPFHRTNLKKIMSIHKTTSVQKGSTQSSKKKDGQMQRMLEVARARGESMEDHQQKSLS